LDNILNILGGPNFYVNFHVYTPQRIENGVKFGTARNKYNANICEIVKDKDYTIKLVKLIKPKYNHKTNTFTPPKKIVKYIKEGIKDEQLLDEFRKICY
jgi:hypothetical protein